MAVRTPATTVGGALVAALPRWYQEATDNDRFVFPRWLRHGGVAYVMVTLPACILLAPPAQGVGRYMGYLSVVAVFYALPGLVVAVVASLRVAACDRLVWRLWALGYAYTLLAVLFVYLDIVHGWDGSRRAAAPGVAAMLVVFAVANTVIMRLRSGQRAALIDAADILMATLALVVPVGLLVAEPIVTSPNSWFTNATALSAVGACHGGIVAATVAARLRPGDRTTAGLALVLMVMVLVDSVAGVVQGLNDFALPLGPVAGIHGLTLAIASLFFLWSRRRPSSGLDRLPPHAQVRRRSTVILLVLVALPIIGVEAWWQRDDPRVVTAAVAAALLLLGLSSMRQLLSARETMRLYQAVEHAADERRDLLGDVMHHVEADRHRVAAHLHRQAVSLYTAMVSFTSAVDQGTIGTTPTAVAIAAERMRTDFARQVDELRQIAVAVEPLPRADGAAHHLAALVRAHLDSLYGDTPRPQLAVDVDPQLVLDWTTEAVVLRIVQEATNNVWRHAGARTVRVRIAAFDQGVEVEVTDDGVGFSPGEPGRGMASMRAVAGFVGGDAIVTSAPGRGTTVRAMLRMQPNTATGPDAGAAPATRPRLRVVRE